SPARPLRALVLSQPTGGSTCGKIQLAADPPPPPLSADQAGALREAAKVHKELRGLGEHDPNSVRLAPTGPGLPRGALGDTDPPTATSFNNLGYAYRERGDFPQALANFERAVAIKEAALGDDHPDTALARNNVAFALVRLKDHARARPNYERALAAFERTAGPADWRTVTAPRNLVSL